MRERGRETYWVVHEAFRDRDKGKEGETERERERGIERAGGRERGRQIDRQTGRFTKYVKMN